MVAKTSECSFGRYDVMLAPLKGRGELSTIILEFKVYNGRRENTLEDTVQAALRQIEEKQYDAEFISRSFLAEDIRHYGFAFKGKVILIG